MSSSIENEEKLYAPTETQQVLDEQSTLVEKPVRGLQSRHLSMIAIAGVIGTGLFLSSGASIATAGPLGATLAYLIMGVITAFIGYASAEMSALFPVAGGFVTHAELFLDKAMSRSTGWLWVYTMATTMPGELTSVASLVAFWDSSLSVAVPITVGWVIIIIVNFLPVRTYGEFEFFFCLLKIALVIGMIIGGIVLDLGGVSGTPRFGFHYWKHDLFNEFITTGNSGKFLGFWYVMLNAAFALGNQHVIGLAAAETINPRQAIPKAVKQTWIRILLFGVLSIFFGSMLVSSKDPLLGSGSGVTRSIFVIAFNKAGIKALPSIINAVILSSAFSCGNACVFNASRSLHGLATVGNAPKVFLKLNRFGIPWVTVLATVWIGALAYLALQNTAYTVFFWIVSVVTTAALICWIVLLISYLRMYAGLKAQGISRDRLPYKAPLQPYMSWFSLIMCSLVLFFSGFNSWSPAWDPSTFFSNYAAIIIFVVSWLGCWIAQVRSTGQKTWISVHDMDFQTELNLIEQEKEIIDEVHYSRYDRIMNKLF